MKKEIFANRNDVDISQFNEIITLIRQTREQVFRLANTTMINLYWKVGAHISMKHILLQTKNSQHC